MAFGRVFIMVMVAVLVGGAAAFLFLSPRVVVFHEPAAATEPASNTGGASSGTSVLPPPEAPPAPAETGLKLLPSNDLPNQEPLSNPPEIVKGIYLTNWTAGSPKRLTALTDLVDRTELNAMVIDIKDYSGYVAYRTGIPEVVAAGAEKDIRILRPNAMLKQLHDKNIYVIARLTVFQDPVLAKVHPEWAVQDSATGGVWKDKKGLSWMNAASREVWDYTVALTRDAFERGFDEVNFDYIRFPSDGNLETAEYPGWDGVTAHATVIRHFFQYLREQLPGRKISADLFGLTTSAADDLGIGQKILDAYPNFDYVSPMVYPSHFASGFNGFKNPAEHPYEVVSYSMTKALERLRGLIVGPRQASSTATSTPQESPAPEKKYAKLRPWLQAFDLGAVYTTTMMNEQIRAADEVLGPTPHYAGWLLWDPSNIYRNYK